MTIGIRFTIYSNTESALAFIHLLGNWCCTALTEEQTFENAVLLFQINSQAMATTATITRGFFMCMYSVFKMKTEFKI